MSDKDKIKELFQKELGNYQAKVKSNLWNGIQAGIGSAGTASGMGSSLGLVGKIVISVSIAAAVTVGTLLVVNNDKKTPKEDQSISNLKTEDTVSKGSVEQTELKEEKLNTLNNESIPIDKITSKIDIQPNNTKNKETNLDDSPKKHANESNQNINKEEVDQETKTAPQQSENNISDPAIVEKNTKSKKTPVDPTKEKVVSELTEVHVQVANQNNQYISFIAEGVPSNGDVIWNFGDGLVDRTLNPEHFYTEAGNYKVTCTIKTDREEITKIIKVEIKIVGEIGDLPNVFTPNGDGRNDEFFVESKHIKNFQLTIIDNQQNIIFTTNDINFRWNGFDKGGQAVKEGIYYYIIIAEDESGNTINKYQELRLHR